MYAYAGKNVEYTDTAVTDFAARKQANEFTFDQLPVLLVDGKMVAQSGAISRYVAKITGLYPTDPVECAMADAIFEESQCLCSGDMNINVIVNVYSDDMLASKSADFLEKLPKHLSNVSDVLGDAEFFAGKNPMYGDFGMFHALDNIHSYFGEDAKLREHPNLLAFIQRMSELSGVKEYLASRRPAKNIQPKARL
jgi:glutathione S-transferase